MTVEELIAEITAVTGDSGTNTKAKILIFVKDALRMIPRFAKTRAIIQQATLTLAVSTTEISISDLTDFVEERNLWVVVDSRRQEVFKIPKDRFLRIFSSSQTGQPQGYRFKDRNTLEVNRTADQAYSPIFEYYGNDSAVTTATTLLFRDDILKIIKDLVWSDVFKDREETDHQADSFAKGTAGLAKLNSDFHRKEDPDFIDSSEDEVSDILN